MRQAIVTGTIIAAAFGGCLGAVALLGFGGTSAGATSPVGQDLKEREKALEKAAGANETKEYVTARGSRLATLAAKDVRKMQIFRLVRTESGIRRDYTEQPLRPEAIAAVLARCKAAKRALSRGRPAPASHALRVELTNGDSFEIRYSSGLDDPFSDIASRELKELLYCLASRSKATVIHFRAGKVLETLHLELPALGGQQGNAKYEGSMDLDKAGRLVCRIRLPDVPGPAVMDDVKRVSYGSATTFNHKGTGYRIVLLHLP